MQVTSIEQSKRLLKLGLDEKTADMRYGYIAPYDYSDRMYDGGYDEIPYHKDFLKNSTNFSADEYDGELPAWSLSRLLELLPVSYQMTRNRDGKVQLMLITAPRKDYYENELEAAYSMICWQLENDLFDAKKLKNYVPTTH